MRATANLVVYPDAEGFTPVEPSPPYVRTYPTIDRPADAPANALSGISQQWLTRWYCHCVGANEYASLAVAMLVRTALLDQRPTIAGRNCGLIREDQFLPPTKDDSTGATVFESVLVFRLITA